MTNDNRTVFSFQIIIFPWKKKIFISSVLAIMFFVLQTNRHISHDFINIQQQYFNNRFSMQLPLERHPIEDYFSSLHIRDKILSIVNDSTILQWETRDEFKDLLDLFQNKTNFVTLDETPESKQNLDIWDASSNNISTPLLIYSHHISLCTISQQFQQARAKQKHVLLSHLNENWGILSTYVPNRTINWGNFEETWSNKGCSKSDVFSYINHPNTLAVFTIQHQAFQHPKTHSLPLGISEKKTLLAAMQEPVLERSQLLMVNTANSDTRQNQIQAVLQSFQNVGVKNTYGAYASIDEYYNEMKSSKFILCPSGMGWDTYRMWEAFYLGTIPVVEKYHRHDGWHNTMDGLPIVWIESSFENRSEFNPAFLERKYAIIRSKYPHYQYEKLTKEYWKSFIDSFLLENFKVDE